ncbi:MAG: CocE/NonD family hydrolase [Acidobacteriota bacterium]|nr:CocE/NonD family hydrolase [Acidobacteriota bacterium]
MRLPLALTFALGIWSQSPASAQERPPAPKPPEYDIKAHYTKYEYPIPMRDGKKLFTSVYVPKDASHPYPFLMDRTPYSLAPYGVDRYPDRLGPSPKFAKEGYIFVYQDVRGRYLSEGQFIEMRPHFDRKVSATDVDESTDTYDTIEWLLKHIPNHNGRVGIWGISYPGYYTSASIIDSHPALKAASPQAPMTDLFMGDDAYHGGAFMLGANFGFYSNFKPQSEPAPPPNVRVPFDYKTQSAYDFFLEMGPLSNASEKYFRNENWLWNDQVKHATYDEYWKTRDLSRNMKNIKCAVMTVGGWFDAEDLSGPFKTYRAIEENNPGTVNILVVGPWVHGGWSRQDGDRLGHVSFAAKTGEYFRDQIQLPFFEQYLKGNADAKLPEAYVFETGTNVWRKYEAWPPKATAVKTLYFGTGGKLSFDAPKDGGPADYDEYISDPAKPVPFVAYTTLGVPQEYMVSDQRFAASRTDVLVYQTALLNEDVTIAGPVSPKLHVSTSGTDSDWVVKLIDVYPSDFPDNVPNPDGMKMGGYQQLVRGEPMRGKFRNSFEKPEPFAPGKLAEVNFDMPDINHTFRRGHRIMVQVQSSWFPLVDRNPQRFVDIPNAKAADFQKATQRVYRSRSAPSGVAVHVLGAVEQVTSTR